MYLRDTWRETLLDGSYAGQRIDILSTEDEWAQALAEYSAPRRDGARMDPQGQEPRRTRCSVVFFEREVDANEDAFAGDDHLTRFAFFVQTAMQARAPREFVHPLFGSYSAYARNVSCRAAASEPNVLLVEVDFVEDSDPALLQEQTGSLAGAAQVALLAADVEQLAGNDAKALAVAASARKLAEDWSVPDTDDINRATQSVNAALSELSDQISDALGAVAYATQLDRFALVRTLHRLHDTARRAGEQLRRSEPRLVSFTVNASTSLRGVAVALYGAAAAAAGRYDDLVAMNDLPDPTFLAPGTVLRVIATTTPGPGLRAGAQR